MANVVLINVFEVPEDKDEEFLSVWDQGAAILERQPGYVSTALHRSLDLKRLMSLSVPPARFRYINIAIWESAEAFSAAINNPEFLAYRDAFQPFHPHPSLYEVIRR